MNISLRCFTGIFFLFPLFVWMACGSNSTGSPDGAPTIDSSPFSDGAVPRDVPVSSDARDAAVEDSAAVDAQGDALEDAGDADLPGDDTGVALACSAAVFDDHPPRRLDESGCFDPGKAGVPIPSFFPYQVNSPLWSDGADKTRFLFVPAGTSVAVKDCDQHPDLCLPLDQGGSPEDEGHFTFPEGSILVKNFALGGKLIETRVLALATVASGWKAYSYEWNADATVATLLDDGKDRVVGAQTWHFPSRSDCMRCHTAAAGRTLGPSTRQLDRIADGANQLDRLVALGVLGARPKKLEPMPDPSLPGPVEARARSYLDANCAYCHRPDGPFADLDFRYAVPFLDMKACDVPILRGSYDPTLPPKRIVPGKPEESSLSFRMHDREGYAMPKIGSNVVDPQGTTVVDQWIREMAGCPVPLAP